jgi:hypothetical protein
MHIYWSFCDVTPVVETRFNACHIIHVNNSTYANNASVSPEIQKSKKLQT